MPQLHAAVDIFDEIIQSRSFPDRAYLASLFDYLKAMGVSRVNWIVDDVWNLYENYPGGFDLLREAVALAHERGLSFHAVYKPFEGVLDVYFMPHSAPQPAEVPVWNDERGLIPVVRPFDAAHPELSLAADPSIVDAGKPIMQINLVHDSDEPVGLTRNAVRLRTGSKTGQWSDWQQVAQVREFGDDSRFYNGVEETVTAVHLSGLNIPADQPYFDIEIDHAHAKAICNSTDAIVELFDIDGNCVPLTMGTRPRQELRYDWVADDVMRQLIRWSDHPEVASFLDDKQGIAKLDGDVFLYDHVRRSHRMDSQEQGGLTFFRGRPARLPGALHPVYPAVRNHWLDVTRYCLDCGVDGVDYRSTTHLRPQYMHDYGFNDAAIEAADGATDRDAMSRVLRDSFTQFLREAAELIHSRDKQIGVHLLGGFNERPDVQASVKNLMPGIGRDWRVWVDEIVDYATFRGSPGSNEQTMKRVVDPFIEACQAASVEFTLQSARLPLTGIRRPDLSVPDDARREIEGEIRNANARPGVAAYQLYETASFTTVDQANNFVGSDELLELVKTQLK